MADICGKIVQFLRKAQRISRVRVSPDDVNQYQAAHQPSVKPSFIHALFQLFPQHISTHQFAHLPLVEHNFYPVSTAPTINTTKGKFKERL